MKSKIILLASGQGVGKSRAVDEVVIELARQGKKSLVAVPTVDIAMQHVKEIQPREKVFTLRSHRNTFAKYPPDFRECPKFDDIQKLAELGISSAAYKDRFCGSCIHESRCPFPHQYANMLLDKYKVVICQHAHFTAAEALVNIRRKRFDCLFVDESFLENVLVVVRATDYEIELLKHFEDRFDWVTDLCRWLKEGGYPQAKMYPQVDELEEIKHYFDRHTAPWRIPEFQRYYNDRHFMDINVGLYVFYPIPQMPVTVLTDATPPLEMLKIVLDTNEIEVRGGDEIIDFRKQNPGNRLYQVIDGSVSKTSLREPIIDGEYQYYRFIDMLSFIGDTGRHQYKDKKILITCYKSYKKLAHDWLSSNYPDIMDRVLINHMSVGTNAFAEYEVQFLLCGIYLNAKDYHKQVFELKTIANYWNREHDRQEIPNFYHFGIGENASIDKIDEPIMRIHPDGPDAGLFRYDDFVYRRPEDYYCNLVEKYMIAQTQQSIRLRFNDDKLKIVYVFGNFPLPNFLVTDSFLEDDLLGYLRKVPG